MDSLNDFEELEEFKTDANENEDKKDNNAYTTIIAPEKFTPITKEDVEKIHKYDNMQKFNAVFANESNETLEELGEKQSKSEIHEDKSENRKSFFINLQQWYIDYISEATACHVLGEKDHIRTARFGKLPVVKFTKAAETNKNSLPLLIMLMLILASVGVAFGVNANSYFILKNGYVDAFSCTFAWLIVSDMPTVLNPFHYDIFLIAFFIVFGFTSIIGYLVWLDYDAKIRARVGHEHGNSQLAKPKYFKKYKKKFMD